MDENDYDYDEDEEDTGFAEGYEAFKEQIVFLIDATEPMFQNFIPQQDEEAGGTYFTYAMAVVKTFLKSKIFANPSDEIALLFYGTNEAQNASNFPNIYTFLPLDLTDATRIKQVEELTDEVAKERFGSMGATSDVLPYEMLRMGLWAANNVFINKSKAAKKLFLMTSNDNPFRDSTASRANILSRAAELKNAQVSLQFLPLPTPGKLFDMDQFWQELLLTCREGESSSSSSSSSSIKEDIASEYAYLQEMAQLKSFTGEDMSACMASLDTLVRKKTHKRRAVSKLRWTIVDGVSIAVQVYNLVQACPKPAHINVHAISNTMLRVERKLISGETGAPLTDQDKVTVFQASKVPPDRFPPEVPMSRDAVAAVKAVMDPGLKLLGFKPRALLRDYHQSGHSSFLRPNEYEVRGSVTVFKALLDAMVREDKIAICSYRRGKSSDARLVALLPQLEVKDMFQVQISPEGMHLIQLPFMDDIRCPEKEASVVGQQIFRAGDEEVDKAADMIEALTFPADAATGASTFDCSLVANPYLQRCYLAIECRAMGQEVPPLEPNPDWDESQPDINGIEKHHNLIQAYMEMVYGQGSSDGAKGTKRSLASASKQEQTSTTAEAYLGFDWEQLANRPGGLEKLTIKDLRIYLMHHNLPVSGKKEDLCVRIRKHLEVEL